MPAAATAAMASSLMPSNIDTARRRGSTFPAFHPIPRTPSTRTGASQVARAERRRRLAEPDLEFRAFCSRRRLPASSTPQLERAWDAWQAERYQRGEISQRPGYTDNPFRPR